MNRFLREFTRERPLFVVAVLLALPVPATAHDFWIEPASFRPAVGTDVPLKLYVGEHFKGDSLIYLPARIERFALLGPGGERALTAIPGDDPAARFRPDRAGLYTVIYRSTNDSVRFDTAEEFERYLDKEGLERVRQLNDYRTRLAHRPIRERFSRCAKALIAAGAAGAGADRPTGMRLELIAERNPYAQGHGDRVPVRLLYDGRPLAGALITAFNKTAPLAKIRLRTDSHGRVTLRLPRGGTWLVTAVHLLPAPGGDAEWESLWASLSFELPVARKN
jgi:hypothetical protein